MTPVMRQARRRSKGSECNPKVYWRLAHSPMYVFFVSTGGWLNLSLRVMIILLAGGPDFLLPQLEPILAGVSVRH